ncbi:EamA family transporter [Eremococcus coleocola]|uniref:EamA family transporter n=1 Tax=Eremococcus coleocola TaxID=88132 RepID=UPI0009D63DC8
MLGLIHTGFAYVLYFSSIGKLPSHWVALFSYLDPIVALILATIFFKELLTLRMVFGIILVFSGILLVDLKNPD